MQNEKRFLLALALTMAFLYVWFEYFAPKPSPPPPPTEAAAPTAPSATPESRPTVQPKITAPTTAPKLTSRETPLFSATWTNQPGSPLRMTLKNYGTEARRDAPRIQVIPFQGTAEPPLQWTFEAGGRSFPDAGVSYEEHEIDERTLAYERELTPSLTVRKKLNWNPSEYWQDQTVTVTNRGAEPVKLKASVGLSTGDANEKPKGISWLGARAQPLQVSAYISEKATYWPASEILSGKPVPPGEIRWAGFDSQYFLMTAIPLQGRWAELKMSAQPRKAPGNEGVDRVDLTMLYPPYDIPAGGSQSFTLRLYAGPKEIGILEKAGASLDRAIDLGDWLGWIARPMLFFLRWIYSILPNYGLAIVLLTVAVRLLMFPLAQKQAKSMKRMQEHKPQMDALKEKYKDDKETYSRELMTYMRTHKINPMGGCLLLLPQLPIFFALYRVLWNSIELRHAPFMLWIDDLAAHDPYFVLPVLLGISMWLQQKMTPTPGVDPAQQSMMKIMPLLFTAMMIFLPAGLNLYIFVSTLWGVVQQYWVQRQISPAANHAEKVSRK